MAQLARMRHLAASGFTPRRALDVGAHRGQWSADFQAVFPGCAITQFEADPVHRAHLRPDAHVVLLSDVDSGGAGVPF